MCNCVCGKMNCVSSVQGRCMWRETLLILYFVLFPSLGLAWCAVVMRTPYHSADTVELMETLIVTIAMTLLLRALVRVTTKPGHQASPPADASHFVMMLCELLHVKAKKLAV